MNSYFIFAVALTVIYILYYAFIIFKDLNAANGKRSEDVEVFVVDQKEADEGINVTESESGFSIGDEEYTTEYLESENEAPPTTETPPEENHSKSSAIDNLKTVVKEELEEVESYMSDPYNSEELYKAMLNKGRQSGRPDLEWKSVINEL